jgi:hypothetical protein
MAGGDALETGRRVLGLVVCGVGTGKKEARTFRSAFLFNSGCCRLFRPD